MTLLIRRKKLGRQTFFEVMRGPSKLMGLSINYPALEVLFDSGMTVCDYDAWVLDGQRWN